MKKIYICAAYMGIEENYFKILNYCSYVASKGFIPLTAATMYHGALDKRIPEESEVIKEAVKTLINICDEVWVFGSCSDNVIANIRKCGKPIVYIKDSYRLNDNSQRYSVIIREYETQTGRTANRSILESVVYYLNLGVSDELIIAAIKKTAKMGAGWNYTEGILRNCVSEGITTLGQFSQKSAPKPNENTYAAYDIDLYEKMLNGKD